MNICRNMVLAGLVVVAVFSLRIDGSAAVAGTRTQDSWDSCAQAVDAQERAKGIPRHLLTAISLAESGRRHPRSKATVAWPWTINAEGKGRFFPTKAEAVAAVQSLQTQGVRSIDVGCMQVNLHYHGDAFADLDQAFDPSANAGYAARFLKSLFAETGSWQQAAGRYHSATPEFNRPYRLKVVDLWNREKRGATTADRAEPETESGTEVETAQLPGVVAAPPAVRSAVRRPASFGNRGTRLSPTLGTQTSLRRNARAEAAFAARRSRQLDDWRAQRASFRVEN